MLGTTASRLRSRSHCPAKLVARFDRARIGEHSARLLLELLGPAQPAANRRIEQLIVGDAAPEEERESRGELEIA